MCRAVLYLGEPVLLDNLLYQPDNSLVKQSYMPKMLNMLNLAGFGMRAWEHESHRPETPYSYASPMLPVFDRNLKQLAEKVRANCVLAHVRGVSYSTGSVISGENTHPFAFSGYRIALAHNGDLYRFQEMKPHLVEHIRPELLSLIKGTTDSEWIYALLLTQLEDPAGPLDQQEVKRAVETVFGIIKDIRSRLGIALSSSVNLFLTDGDGIAAIRYCFDFGSYNTTSPDAVHESNLHYLSLWYTLGREYGYHDNEWKMIGGSEAASSVMIASEPLTQDTSSWLEVPEYGMLYTTVRDGRPVVEVEYLDA